MRLVITGASGQLGTDLQHVLSGNEVIALSHKDFDITDARRVWELISTLRPDVVINTAAYVRVDDCETNRDQAYAVNAIGARNVAAACHGIGAKIVHISTDYVFGGESSKDKTPYNEFDTEPVPMNTYGWSKLAGERLVQHICPRHFIIRTSGLFGRAGSSGKGGNFIETILKLGRERSELKVVDDQVFSPTYTHDLARRIARLLGTDCFGIFHVTNRGACSWYELALEVAKLATLEVKILPIPSSQYPQKAKRPAYSVLDNYHLRLMGMDDMRPWPEALRDYMTVKGHIH